MLRILYALPLFLLGCSTSLTLEPTVNLRKPALVGPAIPNFEVVDAQKHIYRGGQPTQEGFEYLKSLGVRCVIKLNLETEGDDGPAEQLGMTVLRYPITDWRQVFGPVADSLDAAAMQAEPGYVFIHCLHGQDRTGAAVYRLRRLEGWDHDKAEAEAMAMGLHWSLLALWHYVDDDDGK